MSASVSLSYRPDRTVRFWIDHVIDWRWSLIAFASPLCWMKRLTRLRDASFFSFSTSPFHSLWDILRRVMPLTVRGAYSDNWSIRATIDWESVFSFCDFWRIDDNFCIRVANCSMSVAFWEVCYIVVDMGGALRHNQRPTLMASRTNNNPVMPACSPGGPMLVGNPFMSWSIACSPLIAVRQALLSLALSFPQGFWPIFDVTDCSILKSRVNHYANRCKLTDDRQCEGHSKTKSGLCLTVIDHHVSDG